MLEPRTSVSFANIERIIPDIYCNTLRQLRQLPHPRILKSHEPYDARYGRTIYLVRDPRDVAVSYFRYLQKVQTLPADFGWERFVPLFLSGEVHSYGSWNDHVGGWLNQRAGREDFVVIRYEDLLADTLGKLEVLASFLSVQRTRAELQAVIDRCSIEAMRASEQRDRPPIASTPDLIRAGAIVGNGFQGAWRTVLPAQAAADIGAACRDLMVQLGYDPDEGPASR